MNEISSALFPIQPLVKLAFRSAYTVITAMINIKSFSLFLIIFLAYFDLYVDIHSLMCDNKKV